MRALRVSSGILFCYALPPCVIDIRSSMYISAQWSLKGDALGASEVEYMLSVGGYTTKEEDGSSMYPLAMSATVSEAAQNMSGEFTNPMGKTKSMHRRIVASPRRGSTT